VNRSQTLQTVLDSLDTAVLGCAPDGRPLLLNQAARDLFGHLVDDGDPAAGWPAYLEVFDAHGQRLATDNLSLLRAVGTEPIRDAEVVLHPPDGARRSFKMHGGPVAGDGGVAAVVVLHETTMQQRVGRLKDCELRISELLSRSAAADELIAEAVRVIGDMMDWAAVEFWALDPVGYVLRRSASWTAPGHRLPAAHPDQLNEGQGLPGKAWLSSAPEWSADLHADAGAGRLSADWGSLRGALAVPIPSGSAVLGVLACYSRVPEAPDDPRTTAMTGLAAHLGEFLERRRAEEVTVELERTRDEYIALVGHELRTPLTSIQAYTEMMRAEPDLPAGDRADMLEVVHRNTTALHALVAKLLDVAGTRAGHIQLHPRRMDLAAVARGAADHVHAAEPDLCVMVNAPAKVIIDGDAHRLRGVVDELLANALAWTSDQRSVAITIHADEHTAVLSVSNAGTQVPADDRARVFDLFFRTGTAQAHGGPRPGLGLTLARAVVEQHGGTIAVSAPDEVVTTITVRLPTSRHPEPRSGG
jgi:signal transduction histidine kinase